jgi:hypothetical protein
MIAKMSSNACPRAARPDGFRIEKSRPAAVVPNISESMKKL